MSRNKFFSLEAEDLEVQEETPVDDSEILESAGEIQDADDEAAEMSDEIDDVVEMSDAAGESVDTLTDTADTMAETLDDGGEGMDETTAKLAEVTIESIKTRLKYAGRAGRVPSMENFANPKSRREATRLALEEVGDFVKKVIEQLKQIIAKVMAKLKAFFANLGPNLAKLQKHLELLKSKAKTIAPETKPKSETITKGSVLRAFSVDGKCDVVTIKEIAQNQADLVKASQNVATKIASVEDLIGKSDEIAKAMMVDGKTTFGPLFGGRDLEVGIEDAIFSISFKETEKVAESMPALKPGEIVPFIEEIEKFVAEAMKAADENKLAQKAFDKILKEVDSEGKDVDKKLAAQGEAGTASRETFKKRFAVARSLVTSAGTLMGSACSQNYSVVKAASDYASACISNLGDAKEAKEAPGEGEGVAA